MSDDRIHRKLDQIQEDLTEIKVTMARNTESLEYHIKRTNLLEAEVNDLREELKPVQDHIKLVAFLVKAGSWAIKVFGLAGGITLIKKLFF